MNYTPPQWDAGEKSISLMHFEETLVKEKEQLKIWRAF